ncbi:MAG: efflux RND transporter periplasmic adaptor subunit [Gammaproteobacteria bacterium]|nr:efflux RND transporter periplasmic adaptor subunit [Gammaproteobacteria bacterium]MDH5650964.1 efflux RND transporter periplasmic adaptor subunit [Gammaproteobacteria bacterium]
MTKNNLTHFLISLLFIGSSTTAFALDIPAKLHWSKRVEMAAPVNGIIAEVNVHIGQRVKKDTVLVKLDMRGYEAAVNKAGAKVANLKEVHLEAKRERDRAQEMYDRTLLSEHDLQMAKNGYTHALAEYKTAQAELLQAQLDLEYSALRAPFDAVVVQRSAEPGQTVVSQLKPEVLVVVAAADQMLARGYIEQDDLNGDMQGQSATVVVDGQRYQGKVKHVGLEPAVLDKKGTFYEIEVEFTTGQRTLRAGQQAKISIK